MEWVLDRKELLISFVRYDKATMVKLNNRILIVGDEC